MRALVVYESMFGNTEAVARGIGEGFAGSLPVTVVEVGEAPTSIDPDIAVLVVGGPTHAFGMSRASTRQDASTHRTEPLVSRGIGVREWIASLEPLPPGIGVAAFDTHMDAPRVISRMGSAAHPIERRLVKRGAKALTVAEHFWVADMQGPLREGELERARALGATIAAEVRHRIESTTTANGA